MSIATYKDLIVWQRSIQLVSQIYEVTEQFPDEEKFGLVSQMRRAAVSIPANIAEGRRRGSAKSFHAFLKISFGSGAELETHIEIAKILGKTKSIDYEKVDSLLDEVMRMLNRMLQNPT